MKCGIFYTQKKTDLDLEGYCRTIKQLIDWECETRDSEIFANHAQRTPDSVFMMIDVNVRVAEGTLENLPFMV